MKKYIFFTGDIYPLGGIQIYLSGKTKYLEKLGWQVFVFYNGFHKGKCVFPKLNDYIDGKTMELFFLPNQLPNQVITNVLKEMKNKISYSSEDIIYIESNYDIGAVWAELFAREVKGKHSCLSCNELFRGDDKHYNEFLDFFKFKYDRYELAGISNESMKKLFEGAYENVPVDDSHLFSAAADDTVQDIENETINNIKQCEFNICYIGRAKKESFKTISQGVKNFCEKYSHLDLQYIVVGDCDDEDKRWITDYFKDTTNVLLTYTGTLSPVPRVLFSKIDITVAGSGCAIMSALEGVPTVLVDAKDYMSNGLLGYDTNNFLYRDTNGKCELIENSIENCLIKKNYENKEFSLKKELDNNLLYDEHFKFFGNEHVEFYPVDKLIYPKKITFKKILQYVYFIKFKNESTI